MQRGRGRPCFRWIDGVEKARDPRSLKLRDAQVNYVIRKQWREFVKGENDDNNV